MNTVEQVYHLEEHTAKRLQGFLDHKGCLEDEKSDGLLHQIIVEFDDGVSVDIQVRNGGHDDNSSPYLNDDWTRDGEDQFAFSSLPEEGTVLGRYEATLEDDDEVETTYVVHLALPETQ